MKLPKGLQNDAVRLPAGPRIWSTDVAGGRMHVIVDGRAVVAPTRADLSKIEGGRTVTDKAAMHSTKSNWVSIRRASKCLFARRNGFYGARILGLSICLRIAGRDIL